MVKLSMTSDLERFESSSLATSAIEMVCCCLKNKNNSEYKNDMFLQNFLTKSGNYE